MLFVVRSSLLDFPRNRSTLACPELGQVLACLRGGRIQDTGSSCASGARKRKAMPGGMQVANGKVVRRRCEEPRGTSSAGEGQREIRHGGGGRIRA
jgi:hypothetical protein